MNNTKRFRRKSKKCVPKKSISRKTSKNKGGSVRNYNKILADYETNVIGAEKGDYFSQADIDELIPKMEKHPELTIAEIYDELGKWAKSYGLYA